MADSLLINLTDGGQMLGADYLYAVRAPYTPGSSNFRISGFNIAAGIGIASIAIFGAATTATAAANTTAITNATNTAPAFVPAGIYPTNLAETFTGRTWGVGQWQDVSGNSRAPWHSSISAAPAYTGGGISSAQGIATAFNGDFSKVPFAIEHFVTGASTAGTPSTGYAFVNPNQVPFYLNYFTNSGHNQSLSTNDGRTSQFALCVDATHAGQADFTSYFSSIEVSGPGQVGATSFLANPAGAIIAGQVFGGANGVLLQGTQIDFNDAGNDVACVAWNLEFTRTNNTGAIGAFWGAYRSQSIGSKAIDVAYSAVGPTKIGIDLSFATLPVSGSWNQAALTLAAGQRIYLNATATDSTGLSRFPSSAGTTYIDYNSGSSAIEAVVGGVQTFLMEAAQNVSLTFMNCLDGANVQGFTFELAAAPAGYSQMNLAASATPTSPNNGDFWFDGTNFKARVSGVTKTFTIA